jgi:hypothetical protein
LDIPDWWHEEAIEKLLKIDGQPRTYLQYRILGERLADHVGRKTPWSRPWLQRVARREERWTIDLVRAMCAEFSDLRPVFFVARDFQESSEMVDVVNKSDRRHINDIARAKADNQASSKASTKVRRRHG